MFAIIKSSFVVAACALGLAACNTTSPHHVSTSGALYLNVGGHDGHYRNRHVRPPVRHIRPPVRYIRPPVRHVRPPGPGRLTRDHQTIRPQHPPVRPQNTRNNHPNNDRCNPRRNGGRHC
jgi:hypothetical protein